MIFVSCCKAGQSMARVEFPRSFEHNPQLIVGMAPGLPKRLALRMVIKKKIFHELVQKSISFLNIMLEIRQTFLISFLASISLFSIMVYLVRFNTNSEPHFLT